MALLKKYWSSLSSEPMTEGAIRAQHRPEKHFKFYVNRMEAGKSFTTKAGHDFVLYVMAGSCKTSLEGIEITLSASELIMLEKGTYHFDVQGDEELKIMKVFRLV
jgi:hypothetical protein